jgi:hypothetical protein
MGGILEGKLSEFTEVGRLCLQKIARWISEGGDLHAIVLPKGDLPRSPCEHNMVTMKMSNSIYVDPVVSDIIRSASSI